MSMSRQRPEKAQYARWKRYLVKAGYGTLVERLERGDIGPGRFVEAVKRAEFRRCGIETTKA